MRATALALLAAAFAVAACGGDSKTPSDPCARPAGFRAPRGELPAGVAPGGTLVGAVRRTGRAVSGELLFPVGVVDAYQTLRAGTIARGYRLEHTDNEGFEAEVEVTRAGEELRFKVTQIQGCSSASRGSFRRVRD